MSTSKVIAREGPANPAVQFRRILVATDFSIGARAALDFALSIAQNSESQIYLVHAVPTGLLHYVSPEGAAEVIRRAREFAAGEMERLVREAGCAGRVHEEIVSGASVWPLLQEFVKSYSIDLLVMGTHGRGATRRKSLGPVAEEIFRLADCPVLTVGAEKAAHSGDTRILFATNFKPHAEFAAQFAYALEREQHPKMTVLHVVEDELESPEGAHSIVRDFMVNRMRRGMPLSCMGNCEPEFQVRFGDVNEQILQVAREEQSDLIVLGMRSGKDVAGQLPSAIAYKLVCQAPCPVLTIRR